MTVEVIHDEPQLRDSLHLFEHANCRGAVNVVEEEGRVDEVDGPGVVGKGLSVPDLDVNLRAEGGRELPVEVRPGVTHGDGVGVNANEV